MTDRTSDPDRAPTTDKLRDEIDSGRTSDKVGYPDPATAPLGTDAEAGGAAPQPEEVASAQARETARPDAPGADSGRRVSTPRKTRGPGGAAVYLVGAAVLIVVIALVGFVL